MKFYNQWRKPHGRTRVVQATTSAELGHHYSSLLLLTASRDLANYPFQSRSRPQKFEIPGRRALSG
jgi:hypothetical protein